ncbi:MAG: aminoacyl-tRNA deacylase [Candidatus Binatia bacterium]
MVMVRRLQELLDSQKVPYEVLPHSETYTAQETAQVQHISGQQMAKVVMVKRESGRPVMLVLPASYRVNFAWLREVLHERATLEQEREFRHLFPDCEVGAEPPFGNLFGLDTVVDTSLTKDEEIVFNGGSHVQTVKMRYDDYARLVYPKIAKFAEHL